MTATASASSTCRPERPRAAPGTSRIKALILALQYPHRASYYDDWKDAFCTSPLYDCAVRNILDLDPAALKRDLDDRDAIILLHSCNSDTLQFFAPLVPALADRTRAKLVSFIGNEYNSPYVSLVEKVRLLKAARCDIVATQLLQEAGAYLYAGTGARVISLPHALNPSVFTPGPPHEQRPLDLGFKGYRYPPYLGDDDRNRVVDYFMRNAASCGLAVDITYDRRLSREKWVAFLGHCRGTISSETGSWYIEPDDALIRRIYEYLVSRRKGLVIKNESALRRIARRLPTPVKAALWSALKLGPVKFEVLEDFGVPFSELDEQFFRSAPRSPVYGKAISSRHFDAIGTKTCQIMLRGRYNDILTEGEHYIAVSPSLGDAGEAIRVLKDGRARQEMVERAYEHAMASHTYAHRAAALSRALESA